MNFGSDALNNQKNLEKCLIEIAKSSQDAGRECESNIIIFIRLDQKSIFAVAP